MIHTNIGKLLVLASFGIGKSETAAFGKEVEPVINQIKPNAVSMNLRGMRNVFESTEKNKNNYLGSVINSGVSRQLQETSSQPNSVASGTSITNSTFNVDADTSVGSDATIVSSNFANDVNIYSQAEVFDSSFGGDLFVGSRCYLNQVNVLGDSRIN